MVYSYFKVWYTVTLKIVDECEMDSGEYENLDRPFNKIKQSLKFKFRKTVSGKIYQQNITKLSNMNNDSKLFLQSVEDSNKIGRIFAKRNQL